MSQLTDNRKTLRLFLIATASSFVFIYGGHWLAYLYVHNKGLNNKDEWIDVILLEFLFILPAIAILDGIFIGSLEQKNRWWIAGVSLLPLMANMLFVSFYGQTFFLASIYLFLSLLSSWLVSTYREKRKAGNHF